MRISDWSSDVCSSDLPSPHRLSRRLRPAACPEGQAHPRRRRGPPALRDHLQGREWQDHAARRIFRFGARCRIPQVRERVMTVNQVIVIASEAKQSSAVYATLDCRVASLLAMTSHCNSIVLSKERRAGKEYVSKW